MKQVIFSKKPREHEKDQGNICPTVFFSRRSWAQDRFLIQGCQDVPGFEAVALGEKAFGSCGARLELLWRSLKRVA